MFDAAHIAGLIAGGVHPSPVPHADVVTLTTHKTLRGPRGGCILSRAEHAEVIDKALFPGMQGGPLDHVIAAKAVAFREAAQPWFAAYAQQIVDNASALAEALAGHGLRLVSGGTDNHLMLVDLRSFDEDAVGEEGPPRARQGRHQPQREHGARRPSAALHHEWAADRHPGGDHPGHGEPGRCGRSPPSSTAPSSGARMQTSSPRSATRSLALCSKFPPY